MPPPNASRSCIRAFDFTRPKRGSVARITGSQAPSPLHLDFLAPAWRCDESKTRETERNGIAARGRLERIKAQAVPQTQVHHHRRAVSRMTNALTSHQQRRHISSTSPRRQQSTAPAIAITNPRKDDNGNDMLITITPRAASRLQSIAAKDNDSQLALRVAVESGGCHGFQYLMSLSSLKEVDGEEDTVFESGERVGGSGGEEDGYKAKVIMDLPSLELLKGSSVDYTMELIGSQFKVVGIPGAKSSCGCGTSFDFAV